MTDIRMITCLLLNLFLCPSLVNTQVRRNTEQLNIGFIFSLPYDISNTLRAPLGGPLSLILGAGLALIMFFGMLATPLYYIFGIPPRPYHIRDAVKNYTLDSNFFSRSLNDVGSMVDFNDSSTEIQNNYPTFTESAFLLIPIEDFQCQLLMICHSHGFLRWLPSETIKFYKFFSRKIIKIDKIRQEAIIIGLEDQSQCSQVFNKCSLDIVTIGKMTFNNIVTQITT